MSATATDSSPRRATGALQARDLLLALVEFLGEGAYEANVDGKFSHEELRRINLELSRLTTNVEGLITTIY